MSDFIDGPIWAEPFIPRPARDVTRSSCPDVFVRHEEALDEAKSLAELCERSFSGPLLKTEEVGLFRMDDSIYEMAHTPLSYPFLSLEELP